MGSFSSYLKQNNDKNETVEVNNILNFYKIEMKYLNTPPKSPKKLCFKEMSKSKLFDYSSSSSSSRFELSDDTVTENKPMYSTFKFNSDSNT